MISLKAKNAVNVNIVVLITNLNNIDEYLQMVQEADS
jgi:hypothetical protein